jgi:uncharacterized membrane protein YoaK (UPF0700 family)
MVSKPHATRARVIAIVLTGVAGFVDAFGFLALDHVYTAQMSGNTIGLAVNLAAGRPFEALRHGLPIATFLLGLTVTAILIELGRRRGIRRLLAAALLLEAAALAVFAAWGGDLLAVARQPGDDWSLFLLIAIAAVAMGIQNTSLRMSGVLGVYTTHVTGTISKMSEDAVRTLFARIAPGDGKDEPHGTEMLLSAGIWASFLAGAVGAGLVTPLWGPNLTLLPAIAVLLAIAGTDIVAPLETPERR